MGNMTSYSLELHEAVGCRIVAEGANTKFSFKVYVGNVGTKMVPGHMASYYQICKSPFYFSNNCLSNDCNIGIIVTYSKVTVYFCIERFM